MQKAGLIAFMLFVSGVLYAGEGNNARHKWVGYITQNSAEGLAYKYDFSIRFEGTTEEKGGIKGISEISIRDGSGMYAIMELSGVVTADRLVLTETVIRNQKIQQNAWWCLKQLNLVYSRQNTLTLLTGTWESDQCNGDADVYLERVYE